LQREVAMNTIQQTSEKIIRFEAAFNRIHVKLRNMVKDPMPHAPYGDVLSKAKKLHSIVRYHYDHLRQFGNLRNAIVHQKMDKDFYIAEPHDWVIEEIERISEVLLKPTPALSIASQPVTSYSPETPLKEILQKIDEKGYSQFPIYNKKEFAGMVTEGGIAKWLSQNSLKKHYISIDEVCVCDILPLEKKHSVKFLSKSNTIYDLEDAFKESISKNEKLEAILITEHGELKQKPIGIVTPRDLVRIEHTSFTLVNQM